MKYTSKKYYIEEFFKKKLDLYIERAARKRKLDAIIICDGDEGFGKTGISFLAMFYIAEMTGREFSLDNVFFDAEEFTKFINNTKQQLIIWDEAALGGLATNWQSKMQQMLIQTLMTCRYRQHIIIFNCPKFYRLNSYFIMDRAVGLIHVYSRNNLDAGRFSYYKKDKLELMYNMWSGKKKKPYRFVPHNRGTFPDAFRKDINILDEKEYEKKKDEYTSQILERFSLRNPDSSPKLLRLQYKIYKMDGMTQEEKAEHFKVNTSTISDWRLIPKKYPQVFEEE